MSDLETFLAGRAPDHVAIVFADGVVDDPEAIDEYAETVEGGLALVLGGATGRLVFQRATGQDPMAFARGAGDRRGHVDRDLTGGDCPDAGVDGEHCPRILLSFAEPRNDAVGGLYAEGPVVHAYVHCACGARYSVRWVVETD